MTYILYDNDDGNKLDELDEKSLIKLKRSLHLKGSASLGALNNNLKVEYGYRIEEVKDGDCKYIIIEKLHGEEHKFITLDEVKNWILTKTYIVSSTMAGLKNFEELKEYMNTYYSKFYEIRTTEKSREQLIYERLAKVKRPKRIFKVGARVRAIELVSSRYMAGMKGVIICIKPSEMGVEFDEAFASGHDCDGTGRREHCRWGRKEEFELI